MSKLYRVQAVRPASINLGLKIDGADRIVENILYCYGSTNVLRGKILRLAYATRYEHGKFRRLKP